MESCGWRLTHPSGEWTVAEIEQFPEDNRRREVVEGSLILRPAPDVWHSSLVIDMFQALHPVHPERYDVVPGIQIRFTENTALVPDLVAVRAGCRQGATTYYDPADVVLIVEVVEERSRYLDKVLKPAIYAAAGIRHFWLVEGDDLVQVRAHRLDPAGSRYAVVNYWAFRGRPSPRR